MWGLNTDLRCSTEEFELQTCREHSSTVVLVTKYIMIDIQWVMLQRYVGGLYSKAANNESRTEEKILASYEQQDILRSI